MATRNPPKSLNKDARTIAANAAAEKARKAASRKALREANQRAAEVEAIGRGTLVTRTPSVPRETDKDADAAAFEAAIRADAASLDLEGDALEAYVAEHTTTTEKKVRYTGPMLALVAARKAYTKGANGNPHNGDLIGRAFESFSRAEVVDLCIALLGLPGNPYLALNPGQQSMNLRNKLRHALRNGTVTEAALVAYTTK